MNLFESSWFFSASGGAIAGLIVSIPSGILWAGGGFLLGGFSGATAYFCVALTSAGLMSLSRLKPDDQDATRFQNAAVGITLCLTVLAPLIAVASGILIVRMAQSLFTQ